MCFATTNQVVFVPKPNQTLSQHKPELNPKKCKALVFRNVHCLHSFWGLDWQYMFELLRKIGFSSISLRKKAFSKMAGPQGNTQCVLMTFLWLFSRKLHKALLIFEDANNNPPAWRNTGYIRVASRAHEHVAHSKNIRRFRGCVENQQWLIRLKPFCCHQKWIPTCKQVTTQQYGNKTLLPFLKTD